MEGKSAGQLSFFMSQKTIIIIGLMVGSYLGGYITSKIGLDFNLYMWVLGSTIGGILGVWITYTYTK